MMEGSLLFTSRATRRLDPNASSRASAPFAVRPHAAGFATPGSEKAQRGEQWMPLWKQPATLADVAAMFGEATSSTRPPDGQSPCRYGTGDQSPRRGTRNRSLCAVRIPGTERTIDVGCSARADVPVRHHPRAYLIDDLAGWMDRVQRRSRDKHAPARLVHAERRLADAVFAALTHDYTPDRWQAILLGGRRHRVAPGDRHGHRGRPHSLSSPGVGCMRSMTAVPKCALHSLWEVPPQATSGRAAHRPRSSPLVAAGTRCPSVQDRRQAACQRSACCHVGDATRSAISAPLSSGG